MDPTQSPAGPNLTIASFPVGPLSANCHMLLNRDTGEALVVDPGDEAEFLIERLAELNPAKTEIWLTHGHIDHIGAAAAIRRKTSARILVHPVEAPWLEDEVLCGARWLELPFDPCPANEYFTDGEERQAAGCRWKVTHVPGHSPGSVLFSCAEAGLAIGGDLIFRSSIGRTDLPGGDARAMTASIRKVYEALPDATRLLAGHGPETTLGLERRTNPYVQLILR